VHSLAVAVDEGARQAGAEVRHRRLTGSDVGGGDEARPADLHWADGIAFGTPTYFGNVSARLLRFLASCASLSRSGQLAEKLVTGFTTAASPNGGQEAALLSLYRTVHAWGALIVPTGYTHASFRAVGGNPYGLSVTCRSDQRLDETALAAARALGGRLAILTARLSVRLTNASG
jgi:NAD(P)H dehydrogenase (quinone)